MAFSLWKQLKRRLRRMKRPLWTLGTIVIGLMVSIWVQDITYGAESDNKQIKPDIIETLAAYDGPLTVQLHRKFICGEEKSFLGELDAGSVIKLLQKHPEWKAVLKRQGELQVVEQVDDLSEECKQNAYFSVDKLGNLSLFEGPPKNKKVIRTFFQLDVTYMESSLPKERLESLNRGIRISDLAEYNSVISTFSEFAMQPSSKKVMKTTY